MMITPHYYQAAWYVKQVRGYYEQRRLGITSEFEPEVEAIRQRLKW
jgi:hypothetical protein